MEPPHDLASFVKAALAEAEHVAAAAKADSPDYRIAKALLLSHPPYADRDPLAELAHIELERLVHRCPMGFHEGKLRTLRSFVDADMIAWITELRTMVRGTPPEATVLPPPPISTGSGAEREWSERGWSAALTGLGPSIYAEARLVVDVMISDAVATAERVMMLSMFDTPERRLAKALLMLHRPALRDEVEEHERQRIRKQCLAPSEPTLEASIPPGFVNGAVNRAVESVRERIAERDPRRTDEGLSYRHVDRNPLASPAAEAEMRRRFGDGDGSIPGAEPERKMDREAARVRVQAFLWGRDADLNNVAIVDGLIDAVLDPSARQPQPCTSNECQIRKACTGHANCTGQYRSQRIYRFGAAIEEYKPGIAADDTRKAWAEQPKGVAVPTSDFAQRVTDERLEQLSKQTETIALNAASAREIRLLAIELRDHRGADDLTDARAKVQIERERQLDTRLSALEAARAYDVEVNRDSALVAEERIANLESARDHDVAEINSAHVRSSDLELRIRTIEEMAAAVPVGKADPGWGSSPLPLLWGKRQIPPGSFPAAFPGDLREVPRRGIRGGRSSNISSGAMPKMSDDPLEWDELDALNRHPGLMAKLAHPHEMQQIRAALWERSEWVKPAALAPKQTRMDSVLTVGELDDIRKTCETYSSDSCWRKLLAAFDATTASLKAAREQAERDKNARASAERFNDELGKAIDGVKRDLVEQKAQTDRWMRKESEAIHSSIPYRDAVREIFQMTGNPEGDPARAVEIVRRIREVNARARAKAQPKELTVDPDSDFAKIARGEPPSFSFEVTTAKHEAGCDVAGCLGCGVLSDLEAEAVEDNARIAESLERSGPRLYAEQAAAGRAEASAHVLSLEDFRTAVHAASEGGVVSATAIAAFLVECYGPRTKGVVVELRDMLVKQAERRTSLVLPQSASQSEIDLLASVLVELDKLIAAAIKDVSAAVGRIEARPEDDIPF